MPSASRSGSVPPGSGSCGSSTSSMLCLVPPGRYCRRPIDQSMLGLTLRNQGSPRMTSSEPILVTRNSVHSSRPLTTRRRRARWVMYPAELLLPSMLKSSMGWRRGWVYTLCLSTKLWDKNRPVAPESIIAALFALLNRPLSSIGTRK